jgi:hypothetical protein
MRQKNRNILFLLPAIFFLIVACWAAVYVLGPETISRDVANFSYIWNQAP